MKNEGYFQFNVPVSQGADDTIRYERRTVAAGDIAAAAAKLDADLARDFGAGKFSVTLHPEGVAIVNNDHPTLVV